MVENFDESVDLETFLHGHGNESEFFDNKNYSNSNKNNIHNGTNINIDDFNNTLFGQENNLNYNNINSLNTFDGTNNNISGKSWMNEFETARTTNNYTSINNGLGGMTSHSNKKVPGQGNSSFSSLSPTSNQSLPTPNSSHNGNNSKVPVEEDADKKKAQNRAARRAFRERKQAKLANLERQLQASEANKEVLQKEVESLRKLNQEIHAENRSLLQRNDKEVASNNNNKNVEVNGSSTNLDNQYISEQLLEKHIVHQSREDFYKDLLAQAEAIGMKYGHEVQNKTYEDDSGNTILTIPATWEYLQKNFGDDIDIIEVINILKGNEVCHGAGSAYPKILIDKAIQYVIDSEK
ncbi:hypothetical protein C6P45_000925 [Maudiozyma exigua]|uniref:BZIP domain-containing protein n=1 Tax=Maudiozyma exigua TaxID=34358 RepID=A0A9P7B7Y2_MAUEX|nr:hypothetical protein C6P45_000925 [Kazachstania exigua]